MEFLKQEDEREVDECGTGRKRENVLIRFCRKKYRCIMMFLCIIALLMQTAYLIIEKTEAESINRLIRKIVGTEGIIKELFEQNQTDPNELLATTGSPEYG